MAERSALLMQIYSTTMKLRKEQFEALEQAARLQFDQSLVTLFREKLPKETSKMDDAALLTLVRKVHVRAADYGIDTERGIAEFVGLALVAGSSFDERPKMRAYLNDPRIDTQRKLDLLLSYLAGRRAGTRSAQG